MTLEARLLDPMLDHFELIELYETVFGHSITPAMWYWKYVPPWAERHYCYIGKIDGQIIGYFGAVPLRGMKDGKEIPYFQLADFMVHPEHRLKHDYFGLGSEKILRDIRESHSEHLVYGFSSHKAFRFLERFGLGGTIESPQTRYLRMADAPEDRQFEFVPWEWNSGLIDTVWERFRPKVKAGLIRDKDYIFWRYGSHPINGYRLLGVCRDGEPIGFVVAGSDRPGEHGRAKETPVVDCLLPDGDAGRILHELTRYWGNDVMFWLPQRMAVGVEEKKDSGTHCYHHKEHSAMSTEFLADGLYYTMGDVDWW